MKIVIFLIIFFINANALPKGFVYLSEEAPEIRQSVRYYSNENFLGKRVEGYKKPIIILTKQAALALKKANAEFEKHGFAIVVYDGYRPQIAVDEFAKWGETVENSKQSYYFPNISKKEIFTRGYVAIKSWHSRGSTVDITIIKKELEVCKVTPYKRNGLTFLDDCTEDMGMHFDFFGKESWVNSPLISAEFNKKRKFLATIMASYGFKVASGEWWHFKLQNEPFPNTYFNFFVE